MKKAMATIHVEYFGGPLDGEVIELPEPDHGDRDTVVRVPGREFVREYEYRYNGWGMFFEIVNIRLRKN